jgi:hypothetical protein
MSSRKFYESNIGFNILNPDNYTEEILHYLACENDLFKLLLEKYKAVVEIGCADGRHLELVYGMRKKYLGIDIVQERVLEATEKALSLNSAIQEVFFYCGDVKNLSSIMTNFDGFDAENSLIFLPFNIMGNASQISKVISSLVELGYSFYISSFKTNRIATINRETYYRNCGCKNLALIESPYGIRFFSEDGLDSIAFHPEWILNQFSCKGIHLRTFELGSIGIAYLWEP